MYQTFLILHVVAGFAALTVFWIPLVTRKGGKTHRRFGWFFVASMGIVALTALVMAVWRIFFDAAIAGDIQQRAFYWFLLFISVLSSSTAWYGLRVLRFKKRNSPHRHPVDLGVALLLLLCAVAISSYGWVLGVPLLQYFPLIGLFLGTTQLLYWLRPPRTRMHWFFEHLGGMIGTSIATVTAFTVFGAPRLLSVQTVSVWLWFAPTLILVPVIVIYTAYYQRKFAAKSK